jgi:BirA family transcriptional regulator, biotin operon repressor / biotin---[acetyl-CoA-carboxylase] ligase
MDTPRSNTPRSRQPDWHVDHVAETGSTNADLLERAVSGAPHGTVLVADHQTAGRGRLDRVWSAPPGANLLVSVLFREGFDLDRPHELTQRVGVAAVEAVERLSPWRPVLKWPNDLLLDDRKLAGILAQAGVGANGIDHVVVGIGVNLGWAPEGAARAEGVDRDALLDALLDRLAARWGEPIGPEYRARLRTLGRRVRVELPDGVVEGTAVSVGDGGELVVRRDEGGGGGDRRDVVVTVGDVVHLRPG